MKNQQTDYLTWFFVVAPIRNETAIKIGGKKRERWYDARPDDIAQQSLKIPSGSSPSIHTSGGP